MVINMTLDSELGEAIRTISLDPQKGSENQCVCVCMCVCGGGGEHACPYLQAEQLQQGNGETCSDYTTATDTSRPLSTQFFLTLNLFLFRYSLLSFINYTCTDASPSCDTNLALDVVFIFKDVSTFAKVHAQVKRDANSQSKAALSVN